MIVLKDEEIVFFHIPRTGGISLSRFLVRACGGKFVNPLHGPMPARYRGSLDYFKKIAVVREPVERLISLWRFSCHTTDANPLGFDDFNFRSPGVQQKINPGLPAHKKYLGMSFYDFVKEINSIDYDAVGVSRMPGTFANQSTFLRHIGFDFCYGDCVFTIDGMIRYLSSMFHFDRSMVEMVNTSARVDAYIDEDVSNGIKKYTMEDVAIYDQAQS